MCACSMFVVYAHHREKGWTLADMASVGDIELEENGNQMPPYSNVITGYKNPSDFSVERQEKVYTIHTTQTRQNC
jgi:hypothetical protein